MGVAAGCTGGSAAGARPRRRARDRPAAAVFLIWSGWMLSAKRIAGATSSVRRRRRDALAIYSVGAAVYVPHLFEHLRDPLRRHRRGLRDDLRVLLHDGRDRRLGGARAARCTTSSTASAAASARRDEVRQPVGRDHRRGPLALGGRTHAGPRAPSGAQGAQAGEGGGAPQEPPAAQAPEPAGPAEAAAEASGRRALGAAARARRARPRWR